MSEYLEKCVDKVNCCRLHHLPASLQACIRYLFPFIFPSFSHTNWPLHFTSYKWHPHTLDRIATSSNLFTCKTSVGRLSSAADGWMPVDKHQQVQFEKWLFFSLTFACKSDRPLPRLFKCKTVPFFVCKFCQFCNEKSAKKEKRATNTKTLTKKLVFCGFKNSHFLESGHIVLL